MYNVRRLPEKKEATLIFDITLPSVEIFFLQFLKNLVHNFCMIFFRGTRLQCRVNLLPRWMRIVDKTTRCFGFDWDSDTCFDA